jgi:hypothetical protein
MQQGISASEKYNAPNVVNLVRALRFPLKPGWLMRD